MKKMKFLSVFMISAVLLGGCAQSDPQTKEPAKTSEVTETPEASENESMEKPDVTGDGVTLTVGTFNIDAKSQPDVSAQSKLMADNNVEILGIQEVDNNTIRNNYNMAETFASDPYTDYFYTNAIGFQGGEYGIATISKFEIKESESTELFSAEFKGKELADELKEAYMNNNPDDQATEEFDIFTENYSISNGKDGEWLDTFNGEDDSMQVFSVDNVIVSQNITINHVSMIENTLSDHNPMVVELSLN